MFIKSETLIKTAMNLMVNHTDKLQLMKNIFDAFNASDENEIEDAYQKRLFKGAKALSDVLMNKGIKDSQQAEMYFSSLNIDDDMKSLVIRDNRFPEEVLKDYTYLFSKIKYQQKVKRAFVKLEDSYHDYMISDVSDVKDTTQKLLDYENEFGDIMTEIRNSVNEKEVLVLSHDDSIRDVGVEQLQEDIIKSDKKVKTGMWMDNVTGGGFKCGKLYIIASISGGFKSGFMQNMVEYMSMANKPEDFKIPTGMKPFILYINLEMSQIQMIERRAQFYGVDKDYLLHADKGIDNVLKDTLKKNGSDMLVIYQKEMQNEYTTQQLETDLKNYERDGLYCVGLVFDYSDLLQYHVTADDEANRKTPLVRKNELLRSVAQRRKIPVITGIQLNRGSAEIKKKLTRAASTDVLLELASDSIAKSFDIINIPEQIYFCLRFDVSDQSFFSLLVEKDRDNDAKFKTEDGKILPPRYNRIHYTAKMNGFKITNDYKDSIREFNVNDESIVTTMAFSDEDLVAAEIR